MGSFFGPFFPAFYTPDIIISREKRDKSAAFWFTMLLVSCFVTFLPISKPIASIDFRRSIDQTIWSIHPDFSLTVNLYRKRLIYNKPIDIVITPPIPMPDPQFIIRVGESPEDMTRRQTIRRKQKAVPDILLAILARDKLLIADHAGTLEKQFGKGMSRNLWGQLLHDVDAFGNWSKAGDFITMEWQDYPQFSQYVQTLCSPTDPQGSSQVYVCSRKSLTDAATRLKANKWFALVDATFVFLFLPFAAFIYFISWFLYCSSVLIVASVVTYVILSSAMIIFPPSNLPRFIRIGDVMIISAYACGIPMVWEMWAALGEENVGLSMFSLQLAASVFLGMKIMYGFTPEDTGEEVVTSHSVVIGRITPWTIELRWPEYAAAAINFSESSGRNVDVYRLLVKPLDGSSKLPLRDIPRTSHSSLILGLTPSTTYECCCEAVCSGGTKYQSSRVLRVTTLAPSPTAVAETVQYQELLYFYQAQNQLVYSSLLENAPTPSTPSIY